MEICIKADKMVRRLKKAGIWDKLDSLCCVPEFISNQHDVLINWINPQNDNPTNTGTA